MYVSVLCECDVCMCVSVVCVFVYVCVVCACMCVVCVCVCACMSVCVCTHACTRVHEYVCMCVCVLYAHAFFLPNFKYLSFPYSNRKINKCNLSGSFVRWWALEGRGQTPVIPLNVISIIKPWGIENIQFFVVIVVFLFVFASGKKCKTSENLPIDFNKVV